MAKTPEAKKDYKTALKELVDETKFLGNDTVSYIELSELTNYYYQIHSE